MAAAAAAGSAEGDEDAIESRNRHRVLNLHVTVYMT